MLVFCFLFISLIWLNSKRSACDGEIYVYVIFVINLQIKDVRNVCMHSKDLMIKDGDMKQSLDKMVTFLGETELRNYQSARDAAEKIKQVLIY